MALAPFFERIYSAIGGHLSVSRDDLAASLEGVTVGVSCVESLSQNDLWIAELTVNLLARLYPRIAITSSKAHASQLKSIASAINPDIEFCDQSTGPLTIGIGSASPMAGLRPSASGWVARLNHANYYKSGPDNPYSAGAAATFATAELFRRIFLSVPPEPEFQISLLDFTKSNGLDAELPASSIGDVLFVAAGAVGNGALWALGCDSKRTGKLTIVDHEKLE